MLSLTLECDVLVCMLLCLFCATGHYRCKRRYRNVVLYLGTILILLLKKLSVLLYRVVDVSCLVFRFIFRPMSVIFYVYLDKTNINNLIH